MIEPLPEERWRKDYYYHSNPRTEDTSITHWGAWVDDAELERVRESMHIDPDNTTRLHLMTLEATRQALGGLDQKTLLGRATALIIGEMLAPDEVREAAFLDEEERLVEQLQGLDHAQKDEAIERLRAYMQEVRSRPYMRRDLLLAGSVGHTVKTAFEFTGETFFVDAACATSFGIIDVAMQKLRLGQVDLAVAAGIDANLAPELYIAYSKGGVISPERCLPFDARSQGLSQGEGAVTFVLQRLSDALADGHEILGVLRNCGVSSDGRAGNLFSTTLKGQLLAFERGHGGLDPRPVDYVECHGTGTRMGDWTELECLTTFFSGQTDPFYVGSVKSLIGHAKGAAGAAGLLKCILSQRNRVLPPSPYIEQFVGGDNPSVAMNKEPVELPGLGEDGGRPLRYAVNSFGFGGINFHLVLDEYIPEPSSDHAPPTLGDASETAPLFPAQAGSRDRPRPVSKPVSKSEPTIVAVANVFVPRDKAVHDFRMYRFSVPPKTIAQTDVMQLQALMAVEDAYRAAGAGMDFINREKFSVVSATSRGIGAACDLAKRAQHFELRGILDGLDKDLVDAVFKSKDRYAPVTEDTGPGVLNNVIAGRVCNIFDFHGKGYNVDAELNSFACAMGLALDDLRTGASDMVAVLGVEEIMDPAQLLVQREGMCCLLLTTLERAMVYDLPVIFKVDRFEYANRYDSEQSEHLDPAFHASAMLSMAGADGVATAWSRADKIKTDAGEIAWAVATAEAVSATWADVSAGYSGAMGGGERPHPTTTGDIKKKATGEVVTVRMRAAKVRTQSGAEKWAVATSEAVSALWGPRNLGLGDTEKAWIGIPWLAPVMRPEDDS